MAKAQNPIEIVTEVRSSGWRGPVEDQVALTFRCACGGPGCQFSSEVLVDVHHVQQLLAAHIIQAHGDGAGPGLEVRQSIPDTVANAMNGGRRG